MQSNRSSDQRILAQLRANQPAGFTFLYQHSYPVVEQYVLRNQGTSDEAKDVFQDTLLILLTTMREPDFYLTAALSTYVFAISKHLWLRHLKREDRYTRIPLENLTETVADESVSAAASPATLVGAILTSITARCLALLTALFFLKKPIDSLVGADGYTNRHTAQNQKYKCLEQARKQGRALMRQAND